MFEANLEEKIEKYISELKIAYPDICSIWLLGSRANNTAKENSDWDLLIFANRSTFRSLQQNHGFNKGKIDILIVDENGNFEDPWKGKKGTLSSWKWTQKSDDIASYQSVKFTPDAPGSDLGEFKEENLQALRVS